MQFERRADVSFPALVLAPFVAILFALMLCAGLIAAAGVSLDEVAARLEAREGASGLAEKAARPK